MALAPWCLKSKGNMSKYRNTPMTGTMRKIYRVQQQPYDRWILLIQEVLPEVILELKTEESSFQTKEIACARRLNRSSVSMRGEKNVNMSGGSHRVYGGNGAW